MDNEILWAVSDCSESESCNDYSKMSNTTVSLEILVIENRQSNYFNPACSRS